MPAWFQYIPSGSTEPESRHRHKPSISSRRAALLLSYLPDWALSVLVGGLFFVVGNLDGYKREFSLNDTSLQHTYATNQRISFPECIIISIVVPIALMPIINFLTVRSFWDWHNSWLGTLCACAFTGTTTNIVKITVGRPRPDVIDRCQPIAGSVDRLPYGLSTVAICTQTDKEVLTDGWRSFFSGHASIAFAGLGFFSFWLMGKMHLFDKRGHSGKAWVAITPLIGASLVAISRTMDNRHHWQDALIGALVGLAFAYFSYRQYFPPLGDKYSHLPYRPRIDWDDDHEAVMATGRSGTVRRPQTPGETLPFHLDRNESNVRVAEDEANGHVDRGGVVGRRSSKDDIMVNDVDVMQEALEVDKTYPAPKKKATLGGM